MIHQATYNYPLSTQVWHFIVHLRWHYQLFILAGGFLLGGFLSPTIDWPVFLFQFANVHLLLFGGATAYNSYWDKDTGPVGGLKHPPRMEVWMWSASLLIQVIGLILTLSIGVLYAFIYALSMLLFWLYSTPLARWKARPVKSLFAIGISTGTNSMLMGYLAAGNASLAENVILGAIGVALIMLSLYPVSQIYQTDEDRKRGDRTFALQYGTEGVIRFYELAFTGGVILISLSLLNIHFWMAHAFLGVGLLTGLLIRSQLKQLKASRDGYRRVMRIKYLTSMIFVFFLAIALLVKHTSVGAMWELEALLR